MLEDIRLVRELGFPGLVTGVLTVDGDVDMSRMENNGGGRAAGGDIPPRLRYVR